MYFASNILERILDKGLKSSILSIDHEQNSGYIRLGALYEFMYENSDIERTSKNDL